MLTSLTSMATNISRDKNPYHHGDLREALLNAARDEIERSGYEGLSLRDLAASLGVSEAAPYRHFAGKRTLLSALAEAGFSELEAKATAAMATASNPAARMEEGARAYLAFASRSPQLFRLMFVSDLLTTSEPRDPALVQVANRFHHQFESVVSGICVRKDDKSVKAAALTIWSLLHGFALLRMGNRMMPFMLGSLSEADLAEAVLSAAIESPRSINQPSDRGRTRAAATAARKRSGKS